MDELDVVSAEMKSRYLVLTTIAVIVLAVATFGVFFVYPVYKSESWVNSRLEIFAEMPYPAWEELHAACVELAATEEELSLSGGTIDYETLPTPIKTLEPIYVWVKPERVTLRFSGGHSRLVHIKFFGDRTPTEVVLITEGFFDGVVFPRSDQRPIGHLEETRP